MNRYSQEYKEAAIKKFAQSELSIRQFAQSEAINLSTFYNWVSKLLPNYQSELTMSNTPQNPDTWSSEQKFTVVLETAALTESELSEYCREKGLFPEQVIQWKKSCLQANQTQVQQQKQQAKERKADQKTIRTLKKELKRKEAALAETAALLVLRKKFNAYHGIEEED